MVADDFGYGKLVDDLRKSFRAGKMRSYEARYKQLQQLDKLLAENFDQFYKAIHKDLRLSEHAFKFGDFRMARGEIAFALRSLKQWMQPEKCAPDGANKFNTVLRRNDPLGVILVIGPWNYPIGTLLGPAAGAIAAGNCVVLKPSEVSSNIDGVLRELIPKYLDQECIQVVSGGIPETTALLKLRFDHIMYTGNSAVGKIVMRAAANYLTPVTLELGGKCPSIVDDTGHMDTIAQRIVWSKYMNCGQICLTTDYILYIGDKEEELVEAIKKAIIKFYGDNPQKNEQYSRVINRRHFDRVCNLIDEKKVVFGNVRDADDLYLSPTVMSGVTRDDKIMQEEVFGPILPIIKVGSLQEAIDFVNDGEKPLGLYLFSNDKNTVERVATETSSGGMTVNDTIMHATVPSLPFGGVGNSGMGSYRDKATFDCFTHKKSFLHCGQGMEFLKELRYPCVDRNSRSFKFFEWMMG